MRGHTNFNQVDLLSIPYTVVEAKDAKYNKLNEQTIIELGYCKISVIHQRLPHQL